MSNVIQNQDLPNGFETLAENNPYKQMRYTQSFWDKMKEIFGFRSDRQAFEDEQFNNAQLYGAQILQNAREEQYNSPEEQAARMRSAGINPDLQDGAVSPGEATEFDNQATDAGTTPNESNKFPQEYVDRISSVVSLLSNAGTMVTDVLNKTVEAVKGFFGDEAITGGSDQEMDKFLKTYLMSQFTDHYDFSAGGDPKDDKELAQLFSDDPSFVLGQADMPKDFGFKLRKFLKFADPHLGGLRHWSNWLNEHPAIASRFKTKHARERAFWRAMMLMDDPAFLSEAYGAFNDMAKNRTTANVYRTSSLYSPNDDEQMKLVKTWSKFNDEVLKLTVQLARDEKILRSDFLSGAIGTEGVVDGEGNVRFARTYKRNEHGEIVLSEGYTRNPETGQNEWTVNSSMPLGSLQEGAQEERLHRELFEDYYNGAINQAYFNLAEDLKQQNTKYSRVSLILLDQVRTGGLLNEVLGDLTTLGTSAFHAASAGGTVENFGKSITEILK